MSNTVTGSQQPTSPPPGGSLRPNIYRVDLDRRRDHRYCGRSALVRRWRQHSHCCDCRRSRVRRCRVVAFGTDEVRYWRIRIATSELGRLALRFNAGSGSVMHIEGRRPELGDLKNIFLAHLTLGVVAGPTVHGAVTSAGADSRSTVWR
jgi:hypothetical protein